MKKNKKWKYCTSCVHWEMTLEQIFFQRHISWFVPHYTKIIQETKLTEYIVRRDRTKYSYIAMSVPVKKVDAQNALFSDLGVKSGNDIQLHSSVVSRKTNTKDLAHQVRSVFVKCYVVSAKCIIGTEKYTETGMKTDNAKQSHSQAYGELVSRFRQLSKANILQPFVSQNDLSRDENFNLYVLDMRYQISFSSPPNVKVDFRFASGAAHAVPVGLIGFALVLSDKLISISSDSQKHLDSI